MIEQPTYFHHLLLHHADIANKRDKFCNTWLELCFPRLNCHSRFRLFFDLTTTIVSQSSWPQRYWGGMKNAHNPASNIIVKSGTCLHQRIWKLGLIIVSQNWIVALHWKGLYFFFVAVVSLSITFSFATLPLIGWGVFWYCGQ